MNFQVSKRYIDEEGGPPDVDLAIQLQPYTTSIMYMLMAMRTIMVLLQIKWIWLTKFNFYLQALVVITSELIPQNPSANNSSINALMIQCTLNFMTFYFNFLPDLIITCSQLSLIIISRTLLFNEPITATLILSIVACMVIQAISIWLIHMAITKCGMHMVESEVIRSG